MAGRQAINKDYINLWVALPCSREENVPTKIIQVLCVHIENLLLVEAEVLT
jgi:hypothetical protein